MQIKENRRLAWLVLAICALGSIFGFGGSAVARDGAKVVDSFYSGTTTPQGTRESMDAYLDRAADCAREMANEVQLQLDANDTTAAEMIELATVISDSDDIDKRYEAYLTLKEDSDQLYNAMYASALDDAARKNFKVAYDDFWGADKYVQIDPYRTAAVKYNSELQGFPANAVTRILGLDKLNTFGK